MHGFTPSVNTACKSILCEVLFKQVNKKEALPGGNPYKEAENLLTNEESRASGRSSVNNSAYACLCYTYTDEYTAGVSRLYEANP